MELALSLVGAGFGTIISLTVVIAILWSVFWKGWALWIASKENSKLWFFVLLIVNTFGILEIIYIFGFSKDRKGNSPYRGIFPRKKVVKEDDVKEAEVETEKTQTTQEPNV